MMESLAVAARRLQVPLQGVDQPFARVVSDTRQVQVGDLFVALKGEHYDGHEFVAQAAAKGAVGALVSRRVNANIAQIVVTDTLAGLQAYAAAWRRDFKLPLIGVTGSNGKTTTKQLLAAVFAARGPVLATEGNFNNHIGVPLTLCRLRAEHHTAVIEMGASHAGEIALLAGLAQPTIGVITQAGDAHLQGFGSRVGVANGKGELLLALNNGIAIINADDAYADLWRQLAGNNRVLRFGFNSQAEVRADDLLIQDQGSRFTLHVPGGQATVNLPLPGRHNIANALAAAATGHALGLTINEIAAGLARVVAPKGRVAIKTSVGGARLIDDTYNANPSSLTAAMAMLAQTSGKRLLVLGDMAELGIDAASLHADAGRLAKAMGLDGLYTVGLLSAQAARAFGIGGTSYAQLEDLIAALRPQLLPGVTVLVKGSRSAGMERVVAALLETKTTNGASIAAGNH